MIGLLFPHQSAEEEDDVSEIYKDPSPFPQFSDDLLIPS